MENKGLEKVLQNIVHCLKNTKNPLTEFSTAKYFKVLDPKNKSQIICSSIYWLLINTRLYEKGSDSISDYVLTILMSMAGYNLSSKQDIYPAYEAYYQGHRDFQIKFKRSGILDMARKEE